MKENTSYKKNLVPVIVERARDLFLKHGIKAVKMDDIARSLSISKRTVYEIFENKEKLLLEVIKLLHEDRLAQIRSYAENSTVIDILCEVLRLDVEFAMTSNALFYRDLKMYPKVDQMAEEFFVENRTNSLKFYSMGVSEGYFIEGLNFELILLFIRDGINNVLVSDRYTGITYEDLLRNYIYISVRGFCTTKGLEKLDNFMINEFEKLSR